MKNRSPKKKKKKSDESIKKYPRFVSGADGSINDSIGKIIDDVIATIKNPAKDQDKYKTDFKNKLKADNKISKAIKDKMDSIQDLDREKYKDADPNGRMFDYARKGLKDKFDISDTKAGEYATKIFWET